MQDFQLTLTAAEKEYCKTLIRTVIASFGAPFKRPAFESTTLNRELGAFVTLKKHGQLRGCIGHIVGRGPIIETIQNMAAAAAFQDPRFSPVTREELLDLDIEVSIIGPLTRCTDPSRIEIGRHGLYIRKGGQTGLLLPQVAVEWGFDRETFLDRTCNKAGLPAGAWREPDAELWWFEAVVF